jgi:hypothetical protein
VLSAVVTRRVALFLIVAIASLTGCSSGHTRPLCSRSSTTVTVSSTGDVGITASDDGCRFTGKVGVGLVGRTGPPLKANLAPGDTYIQPYTSLGAPSCPPPGPQAPTSIGVRLEVGIVQVHLGATTVHDLGCEMLTPGPPYILRSKKE